MRNIRGMRKMTDEELLELYNKGTKPEGMTDKDYELNMNKAIKLQQDKLLKDNLTNQQSAIAQKQKNAEQSASISNEKLLKYLGQKQQASGLATGQTSSDFIKANNSYVANRANIANNAMQQQTELLNNYNANIMQNNADAYNNEIAIFDKYRNREIQDKQLAQAEEDRQREIEQWQLEMDSYKNQQISDKQNQAFDEFMTIVNSQSFNKASELESLFEVYKDNISDSQKNIAEHMINYYKNNTEQQSIEKEQTATGESLEDSKQKARIKGGHETLEYNGSQYKLKKQLDSSANEIINNDSFVNELTKIGYSNPYDENIPDGTTLKIKVDASGSDKPMSFWEGLGAVATVGMSTLATSSIYSKTITYFDGQWYESEKQ